MPWLILHVPGLLLLFQRGDELPFGRVQLTGLGDLLFEVDIQIHPSHRELGLCVLNLWPHLPNTAYGKPSLNMDAH